MSQSTPLCQHCRNPYQAVENTTDKSQLLQTGEKRTTSITEGRVVALEEEIYTLKQQYDNLTSQFDKLQAMLHVNNTDGIFWDGGLVDECTRSMQHCNPSLEYEPVDWTCHPRESEALPTAPSLSKSTASAVSSDSGKPAESFTLKQSMKHITISNSINNVQSPQLNPSLAEAFHELVNASLGFLPCSYATDSPYTNEPSASTSFMEKGYLQNFWS